MVGLLSNSATRHDPRLQLLQLRDLAVELGDLTFDDLCHLVDLKRLVGLLEERARLRKLRQLAELLCAAGERAEEQARAPRGADKKSGVDKDGGTAAADGEQSGGRHAA